MSLLLVFMAVTSAMSAEFTAVSFIFTYDISRTYIDPKASGKKLILMSHASVIVFAYTMAAFAIGLYYAGISMGYLYELMGVIIGGAVLPSALKLLLKDQNWTAATFTPPIATALAIMSWSVCTKSKYGAVNVNTTFSNDSMMTGNIVALLSPAIIVPVLTLLFKRQNFDWNILKTITHVCGDEELIGAETPHLSDPETLAPKKSKIIIAAQGIALTQEKDPGSESARLNKAFKVSLSICGFLTVCLILLWPIPKYGSGYVFSKKFLTGWIAVLFIWTFLAAFVVAIGPLWEGHEGCYTKFRGIYWDLSGQTHKSRDWQNSHPEQLHAVRSQVSAQLGDLRYYDGHSVSAARPLDTILESKEKA